LFIIGKKQTLESGKGWPHLSIKILVFNASRFGFNLTRNNNYLLKLGLWLAPEKV
jgi:hypothetical protein